MRMLLTSVVATGAVYLAAFVFWGTRLPAFVTGNIGPQQEQVLQSTLAAALPATGRYYVPTPGGPSAPLYRHGPIAVIDYNSLGYPTPDADWKATLIGLLMNWIVVMVIGMALARIADRVADFASRARVVAGLATASTTLIIFSHVIFSHVDWKFATYSLVANICIISAGGLVMARWSLGRR